MLYNLFSKTLLHGTYNDDVFFGVIFVIMLGVFLYFYFADKGESDAEEGKDEALK